MAIRIIKVAPSQIKEGVNTDAVDPNSIVDGSRVDYPKDTSLTQEKNITEEWIYLPAPTNINLTDTQNWEQGDLGKFRAFKHESIDFGKFGQDILARGGDAFESLGSEQKASAEDIRTQSVSNPHMEVLYKSPNYRTFQFMYKLSPFEEADCDSIMDILKYLRYNAATDSSLAAFRTLKDEKGAIFGSDNWLAYPSKFELKFLIKKPDGSLEVNPYISKIKECVITEISVNYTSVGQMSSYENGFPTEIELSLSLTEAALLMKNDILEGY